MLGLRESSAYPDRIKETKVGERLFFTAAVRDITERKRAEGGLRQYAKRIAALQEIDRAILTARQSPEAIARAALGHIEQLMPCTAANVAVFDFEAHEGVFLATRAGGQTATEKELSAHGGYSALGPEQFTAIPLAYGVFCATYDAAIAVYFVSRRKSWGLGHGSTRRIMERRTSGSAADRSRVVG